MYGYSAHIEWQSDPGTYVALIAGSAGDTVRDDITWASVEPSIGIFNWQTPDSEISYAASHGLHLLMIADTAPAWASRVSTSGSDWFWSPPINPRFYGFFVGQLAARYGSNGTFWAQNPNVPKVLPAGIEVWNEPNISRFWGDTTPNPGQYAAMVEAAYPAIKAHDPSMTVISAGLSPAGAYNDVDCTGSSGGSSATSVNPLNFLQAMYADGAGGSFDALGWHPYNYYGGATAANMLAYNPCSAWSQLASTPVSARSLMVANGDGGKKIWLTELGAPTCIAGASYPCVSEAEQANLATDEMALWKSYSWAGGFYWYDARDDYGGTSTTDAESHFGAVRGDNSLKPVYNALQLAWAGS